MGMRIYLIFIVILTITITGVTIYRVRRERRKQPLVSPSVGDLNSVFKPQPQVSMVEVPQIALPENDVYVVNKSAKKPNQTRMLIEDPLLANPNLATTMQANTLRTAAHKMNERLTPKISPISVTPQITAAITPQVTSSSPMTTPAITTVATPVAPTSSSGVSNMNRSLSQTRTFQAYKNNLQNNTTISESSIQEPQIQPREISAQDSVAEEKSKSKTSNLVVLSILAKPSKEFMGYELLQALLAAGLRFGDMQIFHRHEQASGKGKILFSVASATEPGTFDLEQIGIFSCRGLTLFLQKELVAYPKIAIELLIQTAKQLADELHGDLLDGTRKPLTDEKIKSLLASA